LDDYKINEDILKKNVKRCTLLITPEFVGHSSCHTTYAVVAVMVSQAAVSS
jgi:hypothetical protein